MGEIIGTMIYINGISNGFGDAVAVYLTSAALIAKR